MNRAWDSWWWEPNLLNGGKPVGPVETADGAQYWLVRGPANVRRVGSQDSAAAFGSSTEYRVNKDHGYGVHTNQTSTAAYVDLPQEAFPQFGNRLHVTLVYQPDYDSSYQPTVAYRTIVDTSSGNTEGFRFFYKYLGEWRFRLFTGGVGKNLDVTPRSFSADDILVLSLVYDGSNMIIYQNGYALGSTSKSGAVDNPVEDWRIGTARTTPTSDDSAYGSIYTLVVEDRAPSASEVWQLARDIYAQLTPAANAPFYAPPAAGGFQAAWARQRSGMIGAR